MIPQILRQFGSFLLHLMNDNAGQALVDEAYHLERVRQAQAGKVRKHGADEIFHPDTAVVTIRCDNDDHFACITSANMGVCKMFGFTLGDVLGASVSAVVPPPMCLRHDSFLRAYVRADKPAHFMSKPSKVFAVRKNGTIFPIMVTLRQLSGGVNGNSFITIITELPVPELEHYLLFEPATGRIRAVSASCAALLELEPAALHEDQKPITMAEKLPGLKMDMSSMPIVEDRADAVIGAVDAASSPTTGTTRLI